MRRRTGLLTAITLAVSSAAIVAMGFLANSLTVSSGIAVAGAAACAGALVIFSVSREVGRNLENKAPDEESALRNIARLVSAVQSRLKHVDVDLDLSIESRGGAQGGNEIAERALQAQSAFIASLTADPRLTIITGEPGSGKSVLLAQLASRMLDARIAGESKYVPLLLGCSDWLIGNRMSSWVVKQATSNYGITNDVVRRWLNKGSAVLILDGLDEISADARDSFVPEVNRWLRSAVGGRVIVACRTDSYVRYFSEIAHDQVANLEPLSRSQVSQYISSIFDRAPLEGRVRYDANPLLDHVISADIELSSRLLTPLLMRLLQDAAAAPGISNSKDDPAAIALQVGDKLHEQGNEVGAIESYLAAAENINSQWRSLAAVRASLLLAESGNYSRAREALQATLAREIGSSIRDPLASLSDNLSADERAILDVLLAGRALDAFQVSSQSSIPPSRCNSALRMLRDRNLIEVAGKDDGEPRFRRSSSFESVER